MCLAWIWVRSGWAHTPFGKVTVPVGSQVHHGGSVYDPDFTVAISLPAWLYPSPWSHSETETTWHFIGEERRNHKLQPCQGIHCAALFFLLKWVGACICMFEILWIMLNLHWFCNSEIYVLVLGIFQAFYGNGGFVHKGGSWHPHLPFLLSRWTVIVLALPYWICTLHKFCCIQHTAALASDALHGYVGKVAELHIVLSLEGENQLRALGFSKEMMLLEPLSACVCLHSRKGGFTLSPWSFCVFYMRSVNHDIFICLNYSKNHKIMKLEGIIRDLECSMHKTRVPPGS